MTILAVITVLIVAAAWITIRLKEEAVNLDTLIATVMSTPLEDDE